MSGIDLGTLRDFAIQLARDAGSMITSARTDQKESAAEKKNSVDLVTEVDQAVEAFIIEKIKKEYPSHKFIGEETYSSSGQTASILDDDPTWIVDPIDGTTNFIHGFPFVAVSIGFTINQVPTVGVIFAPFLNMMYTGIKGQGSFLNDQRLPLRPATKINGLGNCVIAVEWGSDRTEGGNLKIKSDTYFNLTRQGGGMCHSLRSLGSAALNLCAVASGTMDCYVEGGMWEWDICAGWVILTEAGGLMTTANPAKEIKEPGLCDRMILAVRGSTDRGDQENLVREFWSQTAGDMVYERK